MGAKGQNHNCVDLKLAKTLASPLRHFVVQEMANKFLTYVYLIFAMTGNIPL